MEHSLFSLDLDSLSDTAVEQHVRNFLQLGSPEEQRPREGWRLDFKADLSEGFFHSVCAFANTFGGIIVLGVEEVHGATKKHEGLPGDLKGVPSKGELRTSIANAIATRVDPWPITSIRAFPIGAGTWAAVVRIEPSDQVAMLLTGDKPVYIRDNDRSIPANARTLRALLARANTAREEIGSTATAFADQLYLRTHQEDGFPHSFIRVALTPRAFAAQPMDIAAERRFSALVQRMFPRIRESDLYGPVEYQTVGANETCMYQTKGQLAQAWYFNAFAQVGFTTRIATQVAPATEWEWSIYDCVADADALIGLARAHWRDRGYFGGGLLDIWLTPTHKIPYYTSDGFWSLRDHDLRFDRKLITLRPVTEGAQQPQVRQIVSWSPSDPPGQCLSIVFNTLIRNLGHATELQKLREAIVSNFTFSEFAISEPAPT